LSPLRFFVLGSLLAVSVAGSASAADAYAVIDDGLKAESAVLRASESQGRVWVDATLARRFANGKEARAAGTVVSVRMPELTLEGGHVVLVGADRRVSCGTVSGDTVVPNGACTLTVRTESRPVPSATRPTTRNHLVVRIDPR
jgi:hypothetical protein